MFEFKWLIRFRNLTRVISNKKDPMALFIRTLDYLTVALPKHMTSWDRQIIIGVPVQKWRCRYNERYKKTPVFDTCLAKKVVQVQSLKRMVYIWKRRNWEDTKWQFDYKRSFCFGNRIILVIKHRFLNEIGAVWFDFVSTRGINHWHTICSLK